MAASTDSQPKWYGLAPEAVAQQLKVDPAKGLSAAEAQQRLQEYGSNVLAGGKKEESPGVRSCASTRTSCRSCCWGQR